MAAASSFSCSDDPSPRQSDGPCACWWPSVGERQSGKSFGLTAAVAAMGSVVKPRKDSVKVLAAARDRTHSSSSPLSPPTAAAASVVVMVVVVFDSLLVKAPKMPLRRRR